MKEFKGEPIIKSADKAFEVYREVILSFKAENEINRQKYYKNHPYQKMVSTPGKAAFVVGLGVMALAVVGS